MLRDCSYIMLGKSRMPVFLVAVLMLSAIGCTTLDPRWPSFDWPGKSKHKVPTIVLPIWADTMLHQPNKPGIRGFGARVYFYEREGGDPIEVDGSVTVYVFDGEDYDVDATKPLRKFVITAEQLGEHHSMSDLGHSYSVWVPWEKVGGPSRAFSLITRFDGRNGGTAVSDAANKLLPGVTARKDEKPDSKTPLVQQVDFAVTEAVAPILAAPTSKPYTLTFPSNFERHLFGKREENARETRVIPSQDVAESDVNPMEGAMSSVEEENGEPASGFRPSRFPARREPKFQPGISPLRKLPHRGEWPSHLPMTPRSGASMPN